MHSSTKDEQAIELAPSAEAEQDPRELTPAEAAEVTGGHSASYMRYNRLLP